MQTEDESQDEVAATKERPMSPEKISYAAMAAGGSTMNKNPPVKMPEEEIVFQEGDVTMDNSGDYPKISFSKRIHDLIERNMKQPIGNFNLIDLDNNYYLVKFENLEDYTRVLTDGAWMIYGSYLTVQPWSRNFTTSEKHPSQVNSWLRLPDLPYRYYNTVLIRTIPNTIGRVVKIDYNTKVGERGKFARIAVVIDLNKPLTPCMGIGDFIQKIEYEGLQQICFKCGTYGHAKEAYQTNQKEKQMEITNTSHVIEEQSNFKNSKENPFGPWMVVQPRGRRSRYQRTQIKNKELEGTPKQGSRFAPL
ncbi:uncharacterized protein LOC120120897 [Hibiscus syriacus]|uniref:uncharacterized protein LOC120120897 n=1 Tax=Hibiscus syriacus TaxID=106335 RepID=UPI001921FC40|nr:uncharacterized protein LOC120120897 [Hibiscus syriacus]